MKKRKCLLAVILVIVLVFALFSACGTTESVDQQTNTGTDNVTSAQTESQGNDPAASDSGIDYGDPADDEEPTNIVFYYYDNRATGGDYGEHVNDAVNELLKEKINVTVDIHWIVSGDWSAKALIDISSGTNVDVMTCQMGVGSFLRIYPQGLVQPIDRLLEEYAPDVLELTDDYIGTYTFDGHIYGVPTLRNYCKNAYIIMNKEILEELGMVEQAESITCWSDFDQILEAVYDNYTAKGTDMYPIGLSSIITNTTDFVNTTEDFSSYRPFDNLGDSLKVLYQEDGKVSLYQELDCFRLACEKGVEWAEKGWMWPDSMFTEEFVDNVTKQGVLFSNINGAEYGVDVTKASAYDFDVLAVQIATGNIKTSQPLFTGIVIPVTAEEPEAAARFINELYTNADLMNLLVWGVEGVDYTVEDNQVVSAEGNHYLAVDFVLGNNTLLTPLMGNGADFYEVVKQINDTAEKSEYLGFSFNTGELDLITSQLTTVLDQYWKEMLYGGYTPEKFAEFMQKLEEAGVREYLDAAQAQLDAWLETK